MSTSVPGMRWSELLAGAGLLSDAVCGPDPIISAIAEDSRRVSPGCCFVAVRGQRVNGHSFIPAAIKAGAAAVISEAPLNGAVPASIAQFRLPSTRGAVARLAVVLHGLDRLQRGGKFKVAGITGTNGKSTFCYLLRRILSAAKHPTALLGTIQYDLLSRQIEANLTTPEAADLVGYLAEAAAAGATHAVMEVSSFALDQGRCEGVRLAVAVFSNLTGDHLDYHGDMAHYLAAKKRLFDGLDADAIAVINAEDAAGPQMVADCRAAAIWYAVAGESGLPGATIPRRPGDGLLLAHVREITAAGTRFQMSYEPGNRSPSAAGAVEVSTRLVGRHNVQNCLAAAGAAIALGVDLATIVEGLEAVHSVPGRLQRVPAPPGCDDDVMVLVDYAHTDDALANVLSALRPLAPRRLIALFGCGGDRDPHKRPRMARVAAQWADQIVVTNDNPRNEDHQKIIAAVMTGFEQSDLPRVLVEPDRRAAIMRAVAMAEPGDIVILAGKGHENYQLIGSRRMHFDDSEVAAEALAARRGRPAPARGEA